MRIIDKLHIDIYDKQLRLKFASDVLKIYNKNKKSINNKNEVIFRTFF